MDGSNVAAVLTRARTGDEEAFRALVEQHARAAFRLAYRMTRNEQDAEDVVQESFLRAYRQLGGFQARAHFGTWLHRIVANCAVDLLRSRQARQTRATEALDRVVDMVVSGAPDPERIAANAQVARRIDAALEGLSPLERAAFTLRHHEGCSIAEIGSVLGLRTSATKHSIFRAVRKLRAALGPDMSNTESRDH